MLTNPLYSLAAMFSGKDSQGEADALLKDGQRLSLAGLDIGVLHTPGHTKGSCCFLVEDTLLFRRYAVPLRIRPHGPARRRRGSAV